MSQHDAVLNNPKYKVVELSTVTEETIEAVLNRWSPEGWLFDQIQFVVRDASRRPSMAFMFFIKPWDASDTSPAYDFIRDQSDEDDAECSNDDDLELPEDFSPTPDSEETKP